jgi:hypothetical protein
MICLARPGRAAAIRSTANADGGGGDVGMRDDQLVSAGRRAAWRVGGYATCSRSIG